MSADALGTTNASAVSSITNYSTLMMETRKTAAMYTRVSAMYTLVSLIMYTIGKGMYMYTLISAMYILVRCMRTPFSSTYAHMHMYM